FGKGMLFDTIDYPKFNILEYEN
ncbi:MAG: hypothetical protein JWP88_873, partial [Flaviaesturariibacter sp.]|nr:hypothetical protein [Flaviaesturariibacter sp.]